MGAFAGDVCTVSMQPVYDWIDANAEECIRDLQRLVQLQAWT